MVILFLSHSESDAYVQSIEGDFSFKSVMPMVAADSPLFQHNYRGFMVAKS